MKGWGLASAFRTMTIFPFPGKESDSPATAQYWFVPVGAVLGACLYAVAWIAVQLDLALLGGSALVAVLAFLTRGFHLDGLADMADGFGGGWTKMRILEIMKDSHMGAFGVIALVVVLLVKTTAFAAIITTESILLLFFVPLFSRCLVVLQSVGNPYARTEQGTASRLVREANVGHAIVSILWTAVAVILWGSNLYLHLIIIFAIGLATTLLIAVQARRRIGGITGDILGATVEYSEVTMLVALAVLLRLSL